MPKHESTHKMILLELVKSKWLHLILLAIVTHIILNNRSSTHTDDADVISAVQRAKTSFCKTQLHKIFNQLTKNNKRSQKTLKRVCPLDTGEPTIQELGSISTTNREIIKLDENITDLNTCQNLCFSYGHSYGGLHFPTKSCFCGDKEFNHYDKKCDDQNCLSWYRVNRGVYHASQTSLKSEISDGEAQIRIAFLLIVSGESASQIKRLISNIYSKIHIYYIHVDEKDDHLLNELHQLGRRHKNVVFAKRRFRTIWGGTTLLQMTIEAMKHLRKYSWDYLINLSESDFPIKPLNALETYLRSHSKSSIYLKSHNMKGYKFIKKQGLDRNFYQCEDRVWRIGKRQLPPGLVYSGGSDWYALPKSFCIYVLDNLENSQSLVKPLVQVYNFTLLPVESFFHTLAYNSEFCDKVVDNNLRITNWNRKQGCKCQHKNVVDWCGCSPLIYRISDGDKLMQSKLNNHVYFSRKFDPTVSSSVLSLVELNLVLEHKNDKAIEHDTRYWQNLYDTTNPNEAKKDVYKVLEQFGMFSLKQTNLSQTKFSLRSIDLFFNFDRFKGLVYRYCSDILGCIQLLIEKGAQPTVQYYQSNNCFSLDSRSLRAIEVNHKFDVGERMFKDYSPLNHLSDVVVYHEWFVGLDGNTKNESESSKLIFTWTDPRGNANFSQSVRFKEVYKPTRISLAHRLNVSKPLEAGQWFLTISRLKTDCFEYAFLVFDPVSFSQRKIKQNEFDRYYSVTSVCSEHKTNRYGLLLESCSNLDWVLRRKSAYEL